MTMWQHDSMQNHVCEHNGKKLEMKRRLNPAGEREWVGFIDGEETDLVMSHDSPLGDALIARAG
jgi:hypothetical protein